METAVARNKGDRDARVYLLGGPMRVGKSIIARRFRERTGISVVSTDDVVRMLKDGAPQLGIDFEMPVPDECAALWPFLRPLIAIRVERLDPLLIEGEGISPLQVAAMSSEHVGRVRACFIGELTISPSEKLTHIRRFSEAHGDWLTGQSQEAYALIVDQIMAMSREYERECSALGITFFDMGDDFEQSADRVVEFLVTGR